MDNENFNFEKWRKRILEIKDQKTHKESVEFRALVEIVAGMNNIEITRTLLRTFSNKPSYGVKESVYNELGDVDFKLYYKAYFEELPQLIKETQKTYWYRLLASYPGGDLTNVEWNKVVEIIKSMPEETQNIFKSIISNEDFMDDNDWAEYVLEKLKNSK